MGRIEEFSWAFIQPAQSGESPPAVVGSRQATGRAAPADDDPLIRAGPHSSLRSECWMSTLYCCQNAIVGNMQNDEHLYAFTFGHVVSSVMVPLKISSVYRRCTELILIVRNAM